jgi:hypothetical protein
MFVARLRERDEGDTEKALKDATKALKTADIEQFKCKCPSPDCGDIIYGVMYECSCGFDEFYFYLTRGTLCQTNS